jgi:flavodoxin
MGMNIVIVYDSQTGTTKKAAEAMGRAFRENRHQCEVLSVSDAIGRPDKTMRADLLCIGSWVKGWFVIRQHPTAGTMNLIRELKGVAGKDAIVFCTYKLAVGSTLRKMTEGLEAQGVRVVGMFKFRGPEPDEKFASFAASLQ